MVLARPPRQSDVARLTGLSQATVSRVLRNDPSVIPATKARVFAACEELGYRVSVGARLLAEGRQALVGLSLSTRVLPTDRYTSIIHQHLVRHLESSGWGTVLIPADGFDAGLAQVGAVILIGVSRRDDRLRLARAAGIPAIAIGHPEEEAPSVAPDDLEGGRIAARHLIAKGRRTLAMLSAARETGDPGLARRREGFVGAAGEAGLSVAVLETDHAPTAAVDGYRSALALPGGVDGLFCDTDEAAIGALWALRDRGRRIGPDGDCGLVGFDDLPGMAEEAGLTTVAQDFEEIARAALSLRGPTIEGRDAAPAIVPVRLRERAT
ncbi:LacI family DNA-binding transcriptional regulator [Hasllibacter halocynthiae]|nr:LacI family DNA-binding transcriptional regulator [Hasllibacter halocynthiae]